MLKFVTFISVRTNIFTKPCIFMLLVLRYQDYFISKQTFCQVIRLSLMEDRRHFSVTHVRNSNSCFKLTQSIILPKCLFYFILFYFILFCLKLKHAHLLLTSSQNLSRIHSKDSFTSTFCIITTYLNMGQQLKYFSS